MHKVKTVAFLLFIPLGAFLVVYGGYDDSPGGQLLGLLVVVAGIVGLVRIWRKA